MRRLAKEGPTLHYPTLSPLAPFPSRRLPLVTASYVSIHTQTSLKHVTRASPGPLASLRALDSFPSTSIVEICPTSPVVATREEVVKTDRHSRVAVFGHHCETDRLHIGASRLSNSLHSTSDTFGRSARVGEQSFIRHRDWGGNKRQLVKGKTGVAVTCKSPHPHFADDFLIFLQLIITPLRFS